MKKTLLRAAMVALVFLFGCTKIDGPQSGIDVDLNVPKAPRTVSVGQQISIYSYYGKNPLVTDIVLLKGKDQPSKRCEFPIDKVESNYFTFTIGRSFTSGVYTFCIKRGEQERECGTVDWTLAGEFDPGDGVTLYGKVCCGEDPVSGVRVSDGYEIVTTDAKGEYRIKSAKKNGMVYITVPSGYEVASKRDYSSQIDGILPLFWHKTSKAAATAERVDFNLVKSADQTNHTAIFFGDMHLAGGKQNDLTQFAVFTNEIASFRKDHPGKVYAFTLGDMTWDLYWYERNYSFAQYLISMQPVTDIPIFHAIGNHDHNMRTSVVGSKEGWDAVDWDTAGQYRTVLGPNYYSVDIGEVHYIVADDIYCTNTTGGSSSDRDYSELVSSDCLEWIKKDLSYTDKSKPVVVTMHCPIHTQSGGSQVDNATAFKNLFAGFTQVRFISGHSHKMYNIDCSGSYSHIHEHNSGAVCASWWWAGYYYPKLNIAQDGAPAGYRVMDVKGKVLTSRFKGTGWDDGYQFRSYDRNSIDFSSESLPSAAGAAIASYKTPSTSNIVYLNVWDYSDGWKISVTEKETGKTLTATRTQDYDPLYTLAYVIKRYSGKTGDISFGTTSTKHFFKIQASSASSTLEITVTDDEGRTYKETMERPKKFSIDTYKQ